MSELSVIGKRVPRVDAPLKATGEAEYTVDITLPGMLVGKVLRSPYAHARILKIDTSKAEKTTGVRTVITGRDMVGEKYNTETEYGLAVDKVRYRGEGVAAVAAVDEHTAEEALSKIKVEYEELPAVFNPDEAMADGAPSVHEHMKSNALPLSSFHFGDVEKGFSQCDHIREDSFSTQSVHNGYMEPLISIAEFDARGKLTIWTSHQTPHLLRRTLAIHLGMKLGDLRIITPFMGGGHCGKVSLHPYHSCSAILARKAGRPVKIECSREEIFIINRGPHPMSARIKIGARKDGTLVAMQAYVIADPGAYFTVAGGQSYHSLFAYALVMPYRLPNLKYDGYLVFTNNQVCVAQRGASVTTACFARESSLDMLAEDLGIDPVEIRLKNVLLPNESVPSGARLTSCELKACIKKSAEISKWHDKKGKLSANRGIGIACWVHQAGIRGHGVTYNASAAFIHVHEDGTVTLICGAIELGQGTATCMSQIAAEELGVALEDIRITLQDTELNPIDLGTAGSRGTFMLGNAVKLAAADAKNQVFELAARRLKVKVEELEARNRWIYVKDEPKRRVSFSIIARDSLQTGKEQPILGKGYFRTPAGTQNWKTGEGDMGAHHGLGAMVAEVEVDRETGQITVERVTMVIDCGVPLNPAAVEGQMEGQIQAGLGQAIYEERLMENGKVLNPCFLDYRVPRAPDMPHIETFIVDSYEAQGPFGAKECGEGPTGAVAPAIANAVYDAIGVRLSLPMTPQKVLKALREKGERR